MKIRQPQIFTSLEKDLILLTGSCDPNAQFKGVYMHNVKIAWHVNFCMYDVHDVNFSVFQPKFRKKYRLCMQNVFSELSTL